MAFYNVKLWYSKSCFHILLLLFALNLIKNANTSTNTHTHSKIFVFLQQYTLLSFKIIKIGLFSRFNEMPFESSRCSIRMLKMQKEVKKINFHYLEMRSLQNWSNLYSVLDSLCFCNCNTLHSILVIRIALQSL